MQINEARLHEGHKLYKSDSHRMLIRMMDENARSFLDRHERQLLKNPQTHQTRYPPPKVLLEDPCGRTHTWPAAQAPTL